MSLQQEVSVSCECGFEMNANIWVSINTLNKDLVQRFLNDTLNIFECPKCGRSNFMPYPILYHDIERALMIWIYESSYRDDPKGYLENEYFKLLRGLQTEVVKIEGFDIAKRSIARLNDPVLSRQIYKANPAIGGQGWAKRKRGTVVTVPLLSPRHKTPCDLSGLKLNLFSFGRF